MNTLLIALVVAVIGPLLLSWRQGIQRRKEKALDWEREDKVAEQARKAADLLVAANERVAKTAEVTNGKLDVIHTLVNSNMTAAMQAELDATTRELAMMREVIDLKQAAGKKPTPMALAAVTATESKIHELQTALADRLKQNELADAQMEGGTS
jgi:hypothetical protein